MNTTSRPIERTVSAVVVAVFAVFWVIVFGLSEPPEFSSMYLKSAIMIAVLATLWVLAMRLIVRSWWNSAVTDDITAEGDVAARLLATAVATLPNSRHDWGSAMLSELAYIEGRSARWRFAVGCVWTALFPPRSSRLPVVVVGALAIVVALATGLAVGSALPAMRVFAVTFVALVGVAIMLAVARSQLNLQTLPQPTITFAGVAGVCACVAAIAYFLAQNPEADEFLQPRPAMIFAALLATCAGLAMTPPRALSSSKLARHFGIAAALVLGAGLLWSTRISIHTSGGPMLWTLFAPIPILFATSLVVAAFGRSFRAGVQAAVWAALFGTLLVFALSLPAAMHRFAIDGRTFGDGEIGYSIGVNLWGAMWSFVQIPVFGLPFGVFGAALGCWLRRPQPMQPDHATPIRHPSSSAS